MNWKIIFKLSLFGLLIAILTSYLIPQNVAGILWLPLMLWCSYIIGKNAPGKYFLHGVYACISISIWIIIARIILADAYLALNADDVAKNSYVYNNMGITFTQYSVIYALMQGMMLGIIVGLLSLILSKFIKKETVNIA